MSRPQTHRLQILILTFALAILCAWQSAAAQVLTNNFEDGTLQGWQPQGPVTLTNSTDVANDGTHSLLTTGRTAGWNGPSRPLTSVLSAGQLYQFKVSVRLQSGQPASSVAMTMKSTLNGTDTYTQLGSANATDSGWVTINGSYTPAAGATLLLYVESSNATVSYYIDSFTISGAAASGCTNPPDNSGFSSDFEDGTAQGWGPRIGRETVTVTNADAHSGNYSMLVTGRQAFYDGLAHDATGKLCNGSQYWIEAWVKLAPGQPNGQINLSLQLTDANGNNTYPSVATVSVTSNAWVRIKSKPYTFSGSYTKLQIYFQTPYNSPSTTANNSFYVDDFSLKYMPPPTIENLPSIAQAYSQDFLVGFASVPSDLSGPHSDLASKHFNSVTPGNDLKWDATEPTEGNFSFTRADNVLTWAQAHNIKMRGHTFVWHSQVPNWVFQNNGVTMTYSEANKQLLLTRMKNHIDALINHYKDKIYVWDVVNEAVDDSGNYRKSPWYNITVDPNAPAPAYPEYMDDAFIYARQALDALGIGRDKVKLCYNDYNTTIANKRAKIYEYVSGAIQRGVPIDCVGHQFHNNIGFPIDSAGSASSKQNVIDTINMFAALKSTAGVPIINEVTEFDMSLYSYGQCSQKFYFDYDDILAQDQADLIAEGYRYRDYFQIFKDLHDKIDSVTVWGLSDDESWLNPYVNTAGCNGITANDAPLIFDAYLQHKYAYTGIMDPLDLPGADLEVGVSADNGTVLSGHNATYTITVTNHGHNDAANVVLTDTTPAGTVFQSLTAPAGWTCTKPATGGTGDVSCSAATLGNGASAQFTMVVKVACLTANGVSITDTATVSSTTADPNLAPNNTASVKITVSNPPPAISGLAATPSVIWVPNHKMVDVGLSYTVTDNCDASIVPQVTISSSDPDNGTGDGDTSGDTVVIDPTHVEVRAERSATSGVDRVYTITLKATDSMGYFSTNSTTVVVPHDAAQ